MKYIVVDESLLEGLERSFGLKKLYLELKEDGIPAREIGVDEYGRVVHLYPSSVHRYGRYGIFDSPIDAPDSDLTKNEFEALWESRTD
jgi:hypothetical protein